MQQLGDLDSIRLTEVLQAQDEAERVAHECRVAQEDLRFTQQKMSEMQGEMDEMLRRVDAKNIKTDIFEKELRKKKNHHRETLT